MGTARMYTQYAAIIIRNLYSLSQSSSSFGNTTQCDCIWCHRFFLLPAKRIYVKLAYRRTYTQIPPNYTRVMIFFKFMWRTFSDRSFLCTFFPFSGCCCTFVCARAIMYFFVSLYTTLKFDSSEWAYMGVCMRDVCNHQVKDLHRERYSKTDSKTNGQLIIIFW